jgi:enterochelin esterase family protein
MATLKPHMPHTFRFWVAAVLMLGCTGSTGAGNQGAGGTTGTGGAATANGGAGGAGTGTGGASGPGTGGASGGLGGSGAGGRAAGAGGAGIGTGGMPDPGSDGDGDFTIGPTYTVSPDLMVKNVPHGRSFNFTMNSTASAIYPGTDPTLDTANQHSFTRAIRVYVPMQYVDGTAAPFMVVQDGFVGDVQTALDNLIADRRVPAVVAVFVANGGGDSFGSERGLEYDTMSDAYSRFIDTEVLPAVTSNAAVRAAYPNFKLTTDPNGRAAYGCSSGGAAALTMGWFTPGSYRLAVTYSGTFVDQQNPRAPTEAQYPFGAWEYPERLIANNPVKPLRVFLQVGEMDNGYTMTEASHHNWVLANQRVAAALKAKGYHYRFVYALGATHCDARPRQQTLPDTLQWIWRGFTGP